MRKGKFKGEKTESEQTTTGEPLDDQPNSKDVENDSPKSREDGSVSFNNDNRTDLANLQQFGDRMKAGITVLSGNDRNFQITTVGDRHYTADTAIFLDRIRSRINETINVPVDTVMTTFLFSFKRMISPSVLSSLHVDDTILEKIANHLIAYRNTIGLKGLRFANGRSMADDKTNSLDGVSRTLEVGERMSALYELVKDKIDKDQWNEVCQLMTETIERYLVRGVLTSTTIRSTLENKILENFANSAKQFNASSEVIMGEIRLLQDLYQQVCVTDSIDAIGQSVYEQTVKLPNLNFISVTRRILFETKQPFMAVKFDSYRNSFYEGLGVQPLLETEPLIGEVIHKVVAVNNQFVGIRRRDIFAFIFKAIGNYIGSEDARHYLKPFTVSQMLDAALDFTQRADRAFLGFPSEWLDSTFFNTVRPNDAEMARGAVDGSPQVESLFQHIYMDNLLYYMMSMNPAGFFAPRVRALIDERLLNKNEMWNIQTTRGIEAASIMIQAYVDTIVYLRSIANDTSIRFEDDDDLYTPKILEFINSNIDKLNKCTLPANHPASIHEVGLLLAGVSGYQTPDFPGLVIEDKYYVQSDGSVYDPVSDKFSYYYMNKIMSGTLLDCPHSIPRNLIANKLFCPLRVNYTLSDTIDHPILKYQEGELMFRLTDTVSLLRSGFYHTFSDQFQFKTFTSVEEIADVLRIPQAYAKMIADNALVRGDVMIVAMYSGPLNRQYIFSDDQLNIIEVSARPSESQIFQNQFITKWPFLGFCQHDGYLLSPIVFGGASGDMPYILDEYVDRRNAAFAASSGYRCTKAGVEKAANRVLPGFMYKDHDTDATRDCATPLAPPFSPETYTHFDDPLSKVIDPLSNSQLQAVRDFSVDTLNSTASPQSDSETSDVPDDQDNPMDTGE